MTRPLCCISADSEIPRKSKIIVFGNYLVVKIGVMGKMLNVGAFELKTNAKAVVHLSSLSLHAKAFPVTSNTETERRSPRWLVSGFMKVVELGLDLLLIYWFRKAWAKILSLISILCYLDLISLISESCLFSLL